MALTRRAPATAAPFEPPTTPTTPAAAAPAPAPAAAAAPAPAPAAAAAPAPAPAAGPLAIQVPKSMVVANLNAGNDFWKSLKDVVRVNWDTLNRIKATQGAIKFDKLNFGEWIEFSLISWQDNWLVSPGGDTDEAKALAKYSDDGKTIKDTGEDIHEYVERLKGMDYKDARIGQRCVLAFELLDCDKDAGVDEGTLFQTDLAPTSRAAFDRYRLQTSMDIAKGRASADDVIRIRATAVAKQQRGSSNEYTQLEFTRVKTAAA